MIFLGALHCFGQRLKLRHVMLMTSREGAFCQTNPLLLSHPVYLSVSVSCLPSVCLPTPCPVCLSVLRVPSCQWEVWSRQSCYERLWKVEVAVLMSSKRRKKKKNPKRVAHVMTVDVPSRSPEVKTVSSFSSCIPTNLWNHRRV